MSPLHKLPNGAWIDLTLITVIRPYEGLVIGSNAYSPGIAVMWGSSCISLSFSSLSDAESYADELAALVNKARADGFDNAAEHIATEGLCAQSRPAGRE